MGGTRWSKLRAGATKGADAETVTGDLVLTEEREIKEIWVIAGVALFGGGLGFVIPTIPSVLESFL